MGAIRLTGFFFLLQYVYDKFIKQIFISTIVSYIKSSAAPEYFERNTQYYKHKPVNRIFFFFAFVREYSLIHE